jgi:hypothetical protein
MLPDLRNLSIRRLCLDVVATRWNLDRINLPSHEASVEGEEESRLQR